MSAQAAASSRSSTVEGVMGSMVLNAKPANGSVYTAYNPVCTVPPAAFAPKSLVAMTSGSLVDDDHYVAAMVPGSTPEQGSGVNAPASKSFASQQASGASPMYATVDYDVMADPPTGKGSTFDEKNEVIASDRGHYAALQPSVIAADGDSVGADYAHLTTGDGLGESSTEAVASDGSHYAALQSSAIATARDNVDSDYAHLSTGGSDYATPASM
eukprot:m.1118810 g.1118810  ORF g.1118810 m.1118810 type:complete len:214 (-) comp24387_c0_seq10:34-675(-)